MTTEMDGRSLPISAGLRESKDTGSSWASLSDLNSAASESDHNKQPIQHDSQLEGPTKSLRPRVRRYGIVV